MNDLCFYLIKNAFLCLEISITCNYLITIQDKTPDRVYRVYKGSKPTGPWHTCALEQSWNTLKATRRSPRPESIFRASNAAAADRDANASTAAANLDIFTDPRKRTKTIIYTNEYYMARYGSSRIFFFFFKPFVQLERLVRKTTTATTTTTRFFRELSRTLGVRGILYIAPLAVPTRFSPSVSRLVSFPPAHP